MQLGSDFEDQVRESVLDEAERELTQKGEKAVEQAKEALQDFADEYDVEPLIEALEGPFVERDGDSVTVRWRCTHPAADYFEFGTPDDYPIEADGDVLSFIWTDPPAGAVPWLEENFEREDDGWRVFLPEVNSGEGIAETRFMRWSLRWLRWQLEN